MYMVKAKRRVFLNFPIDEELMERIDAAARQSGIVRAKQARALIEYALGFERKPYIPVAESPRLNFKKPTHGAPVKQRKHLTRA